MLHCLDQLGQEVHQLVIWEGGKPSNSRLPNPDVWEGGEEQLEDVRSIRLGPGVQQGVEGGQGGRSPSLCCEKNFGKSSWRRAQVAAFVPQEFPFTRRSLGELQDVLLAHVPQLLLTVGVKLLDMMQRLLRARLQLVFLGEHHRTAQLRQLDGDERTSVSVWMRS